MLPDVAAALRNAQNVQNARNPKRDDSQVLRKVCRIRDRRAASDQA
jgi:hypothetical protein